MTTTSLDKGIPPKRAMVVFAHPDDADVAVSGTVAKWAKAGCEVTYVLLTSGDKGSDNPRMTSPRIAKIREAEQKAAGKILGLKNVVFLRYKDAELLPFDLKMRHDIVAEIRRYKPDALFCQDPTNRHGGGAGRGINHPDHVAAGEATLAAVFPSARDRLTFPDLLVQGLKPHKVSDVFLMMTRDADYFEDITSTVDLKVQALKAHKSQFGENAGERWKQMAENLGKQHDMKYAEGFRWIKLDRGFTLPAKQDSPYAVGKKEGTETKEPALARR